ncbi:MAG TPA: hypothetical protein VE978_17180 [Chitinophagales bacterium]|nr:hypothetical protein [Chitinophagales bacterium]
MKRTLAYILFSIGLLSYFVRLGYHSSFYLLPEISFAISTICILIALRLFATSRSTKEIRSANRYKEIIQVLKETGEKIKVDFSQCEVKSNDYSEERERYGPRTQYWNAMAGDAIRNTEVVDVNQSVLIFKNNANGKEETFVSPVIYKDEITIKFLLSEKKETTLYIDKNDRSRYYFDLEFLQSD